MNKQEMDMAAGKPCDLTAVEARRLIGAKRLSPVELLESCLERISELNPSLNAIINPCFEQARKEAERAQEAVMTGGALGALHGLPLGVKDLNDVAGIKTTQGSPLFENFVPEHNDNIVEAMRQSGAIVVGKTNVPEHGFGATTDNPLYGITRNPYDPARSAGASSGGTAVALATGMVPLAMGSDFAGSLRTPASYCGIAGFRPSVGAVPTDRRGMGWSPFDVEGPMGRTVADLKLLLGGMTATNTHDPLTQQVDPKFHEPARMTDLSGLKVAISEDLGFAPMGKVTRASFREKLTLFEDIFGSVAEGHPDMSTADRAFYILRGIGFVHDFRQLYDENPDAFGPTIIDELVRAEKLTIADIGWAMSEHTRIFRDAEDFFETYDVLITPAASVPPFLHEEFYPKEIDGEDMGGYLRWEAISYGVTLFAGPAVVIPAGVGPGGMPMGIQLIAKKGSDCRLLDIAYTLEAVFSQTDGLKPQKLQLEALNA